MYGFAGGDPVNYQDPFGLCKDAAGKERQCLVEWINKNAEMPDASTQAAAQELATRADADLGLTSGRRAKGNDCGDSRHDCGMAIDIGTINGVLVGSGMVANERARALVVRVQIAAMDMDQVREIFGPGGLFKKNSFGSTAGWTAMVNFGQKRWELWFDHQDHVHVSIQDHK